MVSGRGVWVFGGIPCVKCGLEVGLGKRGGMDRPSGVSNNNLRAQSSFLLLRLGGL